MKLKNIKTRDVIKILEQNGFRINRQTGTHLIMRKDNITTVVPTHKDRIPIGTLKSIEKQSGVNFREAFL
ncbi:MAG: type II toxin-antitoxin system HicA family toxin [Nanoarchaeota archaeon]